MYGLGSGAIIVNTKFSFKPFEPISKERKELHAKKARKLLPECSYRGKQLTHEEGKRYDGQLLELGVKCITCTGERHEHHCQLHQFTNFGKCHGCTERTAKKLAICPTIPSPLTLTPSSSRLVITVATTQQGAELHEVTGPGQRAYAKKCNADYVAITGESIYPGYTMFDKFRIYPYLDRYDRILFLDADAGVRPNCPDLFDLYPDDIFVAHDDTEFIDAKNWDYWKEVREVSLSQRLPIPKRYRLINSGVVLFSRKHTYLWEPPKYPLATYWCGEQHLEAIRLFNDNLPWAPLPRCFNWMWWINHRHPDPVGEKNAFIVHGAGFTGYGGTPEARAKWLRERLTGDQK